MLRPDMDANHPNAKIIRDFYDSFGRKDAEGMVSHYTPDVHFSDAVFLNLRGGEAFAMWRMLCGGAKDLEITASQVEADDTSGKAHWDAIYTFSATGNRVHNRIDARFTFKDGKIVRHEDTFNLRTWAGMALGLPGRLFGWFPPFQRAIQKKADGNLRAYLKAKPAAAETGPTT
ncbi:nuclear transport factor 2 family protein [Chondromyces crocatus]|uniref:Ketosteroid isomerase n=1 Tax=Chondromyces crocatus TaxID=52 RepID=A0A0K1ERK1_CHOCO|nr:nuclear transport factor 2 family protein [Chondromyces crocatus]AKT43243.1 ketosteroid isomerase [Chondromyces crocatus]